MVSHMSIQDILNNLAEIDDPHFGWTVTTNSYEVVRVEASTSSAWTTRAEAYEKAEELLAAVESQIEGSTEVRSGTVGANGTTCRPRGGDTSTSRSPRPLRHESAALTSALFQEFRG